MNLLHASEWRWMTWPQVFYLKESAITEGKTMHIKGVQVETNCSSYEKWSCFVWFNSLFPIVHNCTHYCTFCHFIDVFDPYEAPIRKINNNIYSVLENYIYCMFYCLSRLWLTLPTFFFVNNVNLQYVWSSNVTLAGLSLVNHFFYLGNHFSVCLFRL